MKEAVNGPWLSRGYPPLVRPVSESAFRLPPGHDLFVQKMRWEGQAASSDELLGKIFAEVEMRSEFYVQEAILAARRNASRRGLVMARDELDSAVLSGRAVQDWKEMVAGMCRLGTDAFREGRAQRQLLETELLRISETQAERIAVHGAGTWSAVVTAAAVWRKSAFLGVKFANVSESRNVSLLLGRWARGWLISVRDEHGNQLRGKAWCEESLVAFGPREYWPEVVLRPGEAWAGVLAVELSPNNSSKQLVVSLWGNESVLNAGGLRLSEMPEGWTACQAVADVQGVFARAAVGMSSDVLIEALGDSARDR